MNSAIERLVGLGAGALSEGELLSLICVGPITETKRGIRDAGGLRALASRHPRDCIGGDRRGSRELIRLMASLELGRRVLSSADHRPRLRSPREIYLYLHPRMAVLAREVFHVLCFNARNILIQEARIAEGFVDSCAVDPREVFALAVGARASAIVLVHNHPSGDAEPSARDLALTEQLVAGGALLGVQVLDHLVIGDADFVSLRERSWIRPISNGREVNPSAAATRSDTG